MTPVIVKSSKAMSYSNWLDSEKPSWWVGYEVEGETGLKFLKTPAKIPGCKLLKAKMQVPDDVTRLIIGVGKKTSPYNIRETFYITKEVSE